MEEKTKESVLSSREKSMGKIKGQLCHSIPDTTEEM